MVNESTKPNKYLKRLKLTYNKVYPNKIMKSQKYTIFLYLLPLDKHLVKFFSHPLKFLWSKPEPNQYEIPHLSKVESNYFEPLPITN